jgi:hypothetical protein
MLETTPNQLPFDRRALGRCIDACFDCAAACTSCADACLGEDTVAELVRCIALDLVCADVCETTGRSLLRPAAEDPQMVRALLEVCAQACASCAAECERHAEMHEHCRFCAEACRACEESCRELLAAA